MSQSEKVASRGGGCEGVALTLLLLVEGNFSFTEGVEGIFDDVEAEDNDSLSLIGAIMGWTCRVEVDGLVGTRTVDKH